MFNHWPSLTKCSSLSGFQLLVTPWIVARQDPLSMEFFRQEYWSDLVKQLCFNKKNK